MIKNNFKKLFLILPGFLFLNMACKSEEPEKVSQNEKYCLTDDIKKELKLDKVELIPFAEHLQLTAEVEYNPNKLFNVRSLVNGFCERVLFSLGDHVKKGQLLAEVKSPDLNAMFAQTRDLQAQIKVAERELSAAESMYKSQLSSERDVIAARSDVDKLKIELQNLQQNLALYRFNGATGSFGIYAPSDGYIIEKNLNSGMQITESSDLFTISDLNKVWIMANVYATDVQFVQEGMNVKIKILAYPDEIFNGRISSISKVFDNEERVLKARIEIDNPGIKIKPGMSADVIVEKTNSKSVLSIPVNDVIFDNDKNFVVLYRSDCDVEIREIKTGSRNNNLYYLSDGLKEGDQIIAQNQLLIYEQLSQSL